MTEPNMAGDRRNKRGRPKKDDAKTGVIRFRCDMGEKAKWMRAARRQGKSLSKWITDRLNW